MEITLPGRVRDKCTRLGCKKMSQGKKKEIILNSTKAE